jgi:hypothetical protein
MKFEEKKTLGRLIRNHRLRFNWTQERLAGAADINVRTVQRAEGGFHTNKSQSCSGFTGEKSADAKTTAIPNPTTIIEFIKARCNYHSRPNWPNRKFS